MTEQELSQELLKRFEVVEKTSGMDLGSLNHEKTFGLVLDEEHSMKELEEFEQLRLTLIDEIIMINKKLKYKADFKKIKKATMKNMIEGPPISQLLLASKDS